MNGKAAAVLVSGLVCACVQGQPPAAPPPPAPTPAVTPAPPTAAVAAGNRIVVIRRATCERFLELSPEDRTAASLFYIGYQAQRARAGTINVDLIPSIEDLAADLCTMRPSQPASNAFAEAYWETRRWR